MSIFNIIKAGSKAAASPAKSALRSLFKVADEAPKNPLYISTRGRTLGTGLQITPPAVATAKAPGLFSRAMVGYGKLPTGVRRTIKYGVPLGGAVAGYNLLTGENQAQFAPPLPQEVLAGFRTQPTSQADALRQLLSGPQFAQNYQQQAEALNAQQQAQLDDYLGTYGQYSTNQSKAIMDEFRKIAAASQALAGTTEEEGQDTAAEIDRLYQNYADTAGALYAGEGLATPASEVSGMVPVSGEMATQSQTVPAYGQSIADYLGREASIAGTGYRALGQSQLAQGAGMSQAMRDRSALLEAQMRFASGNESANRLAGAQSQDIAFNRDLALQIANAEAADSAAANERAQLSALAYVQAGQLWETSGDKEKRNIEAALGIDRNMPEYKNAADRKKAVQDMVLQYPDLLQIITLTAGV